jgi:hypothetical protein
MNITTVSGLGIVTCLGCIPFWHQCDLFGFFWHHLVTSGFPWQGINDGHLDLMISCLFYSWCSLAATLHRPHKITVTMGHELGWLLALAHCLLLALAHCLLLWLLIWVHDLVDSWLFATLIACSVLSTSLICLCLKCPTPWSRLLAYRLGDTLLKG